MFLDTYNIRPLQKEDLKMVLEWRNSERIHSVMLTDHKITWEEHCQWFDKASKNKPCRNLIFEYCNKPIGYIGYTDYNDVEKTCSPGAYLGVVGDYVPIDAAFVLFYKTMEYAFNVLGMDKLITEVFKTNKKALKMDKFLGFEIIQENLVLKSGIEVYTYTMVLDKGRWNIEREKFIL